MGVFGAAEAPTSAPEPFAFLLPCLLPFFLRFVPTAPSASSCSQHGVRQKYDHSASVIVLEIMNPNFASTRRACRND